MHNTAPASHDKRNLLFLDIALSSGIITKAQYQEVLPSISKYSKTIQIESVASILEKLKIISPADTQFLNTLVNHLEEKRQDYRFGRLAVANEYTSPKAITKALKIQRKQFRSKKKTRRMGEILVEIREMSEANLWAVLITQNRIREDELITAISKLGRTELERRQVNKRFGVIAIKKKFLSIEQVNQALTKQIQEKKEGKPKRFIGQILKEELGLSDAVITEVLEEQKRLEVEILNLEEKLSKFMTEVRLLEMMNDIFEENVSKDKLTAYIRLKNETADDTTVDQLKKWLATMGIRFGLVKEQKIDEFLRRAVKNSELKVAQGYPVVPGKEGKIKYLFDVSEVEFKDEKSLKSRTMIKKGDILASRFLAQEGEPGKNVYGYPILPDNPGSKSILCGNGVTKKGGQYIAEIEGFPILYKNRTILIIPSDTRATTRYIKGDIDEKLADIHEIQDVDIEGSIKSGTIVKCRNLTVHGNLLGEVVTTGDVLVKGRVGDKPDEKTNDISIAKIKANGKVMIAKDIVYSDIQANGSIIASKSHVSASWLSAKNEILVEEIEVDDTHNVNITIGVHDNNIIKEIDKKILDKKELLDVMDKSDEKCNWERNINLCIQAQDDIREKHNTLKFINELSIKGDVWNKLNFKNLDPLQIMEQIQFYISKTPGLVSCPPKDTGAYMYLERVIKSLKSLDHEKQLKFIKKIYKDGIQDYRAAVKTTEKIENAYQVFKKKSNQETVNESEIEHLKNEINVLSAEKDLMHIALERNYRITPMLKVKRKIARGAIIKGVNAIMENENDLYGVIIYETKNKSKQWEMIIENYYQ